jgi:hypothetical protein
MSTDACGYDVPPEPHDLTVRRILSGDISAEDQAAAIRRVKLFDARLADGARGKRGGYTQWINAMGVQEVHNDNIYRVGTYSDGVDIVCFGLASIDSDISGHYDRADDLPEWVKERLALLMITSATPPTQEVVGIGRRISSHVYWVYAPETTS